MTNAVFFAVLLFAAVLEAGGDALVRKGLSSPSMAARSAERVNGNETAGLRD